MAAAAGVNHVGPDHVIIWLDQNMGIPENNQDSRDLLETHANVDPPTEDRRESDIDRLILSIDGIFKDPRFEDLVRSPLRMFIDERECIKCIDDSQKLNKKVFLISSGRMGQSIVPKIYDKLSGSIYIFCAHRNLHEQWLQPYKKGVEIYDDEKGVFAKVVSDIGIHYLIKGQNETSNETVVNQYFTWARRLFKSASRLDNYDRKDYLKCIDDELIERNMPTLHGVDDDIQKSVEATEPLRNC